MAWKASPAAKSPDVLGLCKGESGNFRRRNGERSLPLPKKGDLEGNLKEGVRERATRGAEARQSMQWVPSLEVGWSGNHSGTGNLFFCLLCHFKFCTAMPAFPVTLTTSQLVFVGTLMESCRGSRELGLGSIPGPR